MWSRVLACAIFCAAIGAVVGDGPLWTNNQLTSTGAAVVELTEGTLCISPDDCYSRLNMTGFGPGWREFDGGVGGIYLPSGASFETLYRNRLEENETIIHAHGQVPGSNTVDGLPFVTAPPIYPNRDQAYQFAIHPFATGTYFAHSHYGFHHDLGLSIPLVVEGVPPDDYPNAAAIASARDVVMFLEDFCPYARDAGPSQNRDCFHPWEAYATLEAAWNAQKDGFNYTQCEKASKHGDLAYRWQLANGRPPTNPPIAMVDAGEWIRLRVISSTGMTNYRVVLDPALVDTDANSGVVIAVDGQPVHPFAGTGKGGAWWLAVAQRIDIMVRAPTRDGAYAVTAVAETHKGAGLQAVLVLVVGGDDQVPPPGRYSNTSAASVGVMDFSDEVAYRAWFPLPDRPVDKHFVLNLTGNNGFNSINGRSFQLAPFGSPQPNPHPLVVDLGDRVCITFRNFNGDPHQMHLHGTSYQVVEINGTAIEGAVRDTVLVARGGCQTVKICFDAVHPGVWALHCHSNYHLAAGMYTTIEYSSGGIAPDFVPAPDPATGLVPVHEAVLIGVGSFMGLAIVAAVVGTVVWKCRAESRAGYSRVSRDDAGAE